VYEVAIVRGADGHEITVTAVGPTDQGHASCTCGWVYTHVLPHGAVTASLAHAKAVKAAKDSAGAAPLQADGHTPETSGLAAAPAVQDEGATDATVH